jgi:DNA polymerase-1
MRLAFDIETNGLLDKLDRVHCIVAKDLDTGQVHSFDPTSLPHALELLSSAEELVGHNILGFDLPALRKVYPDWLFQGKVTDTLVLSRLVHSDLTNEDFSFGYTPDQLQG